MSKKNKSQNTANAASPFGNLDAEQAIIKHDLLKVVLLNCIYLAGLLAVYFSNRQSHYLENILAKIMEF